MPDDARDLPPGRSCAMMQRMFRRLFVVLALVGALATPALGGRYPPPEYAQRKDRSAGDFVDWIKLFGTDFWAVVSSPARLDRDGWIKVGVAAGAFAWLYQNDDDIQRMVQQNRNSGFLKAAEDVGSEFEVLGLMGKTGRYYGAAMALGYAFKWEKIERVSTDILFSHFIGGLIRQGFVRVVDRSRPNERKGPYNYGDKGTSLPSGHASTVYQLATVLSHHFPNPWAKTVFYGIATAVVIQRVTVEQHWASDAFLGAVYGHAVGRVIVGTNDRRGYLVVPTIDPSTGAAGVSLQFDF